MTSFWDALATLRSRVGDSEGMMAASQLLADTAAGAGGEVLPWSALSRGLIGDGSTCVARASASLCDRSPTRVVTV